MAKKKKRKVSASRSRSPQADTRQKKSAQIPQEELSGFIQNEETATLRAATFMPPSHIPQLLVWILGAFIGLAVVVAPYGQTDSGYNPDYHISTYYQIGLSILLVFYFMFFARQGTRSEILIPRTPILLPFVFFIVWMIITLFWTISFYEGLVKVLDWSSGLLIFILILMIVRDLKALRILLSCLFASGVAMALLGIMQFLFSVDWVHQHAAPAAVFGNKNMAAQYMVVSIPLGIGLFFSEKKTPLVWLYAIGTILMCLMVFYSYTRGSLFAVSGQIMLFSLVFLYVKFRHKQRFHFNINKSAALSVAVILFAIMATLTPKTFSEGSGGIDKAINPKGQTMHTGSTKERLEYITDFRETAVQRQSMWLNSIEIAKDHLWLGTGIGNWMVFYPKYQASAQPDKMLSGGYYHLNAHNDYIEFFVELGIVGALLMLWLFFAVLKTFLMVFNSRTLENDSRMLVLGPLVSIAGIAMVAIVSFPLQQIPTIIVISVSLAINGLIYWQARPHSAGAYRINLSHNAVRAGALIALIIIAVLIIRMHIGWYKGEMYHRDAVAYMRLDKPEPFGMLAKKAVDIHPWRRRHSLYLGHYYVGRKEYRKAIKQYERLLKDYPYMIEPRQNAAAAYLKLGQYEKADAVLKLWAEMQSHVMGPQMTYAIFNYQIGRYDKAEKYVKRKIAIYDRKRYITNKYEPERLKSKWWKKTAKENDRAKRLLADALRKQSEKEQNKENQ